MAAPLNHIDPRHTPVMLAEVLSALNPRAGEVHVDGTFGAGGYTRAILAAAECNVFAIDRDPDAIAGGAALASAFPSRLTLLHGRFGEMQTLLSAKGVDLVDGVVLDIGVSSMQFDQGARGFSFSHDGPLDMRMAQEGRSAADVVNGSEADELARIIYLYGEESKSRAVARAIVAARAEAPIRTTHELVKAVERALGPQRMKDRIHPATKTFQALRIFVNQELDELADSLAAAEAILKPGGRLVVVSFHSLEDRIVKRFLAERTGALPNASRHSLADQTRNPPSFAAAFKGHLAAGEDEARANPRARSAKLRCGIRTSAAPHALGRRALGVPQFEERAR